MTRSCRNKPHPSELNKQDQAFQDGWYADYGGRLIAPGPNTRWREDMACGYLESADDPECNLCRWQRTESRKVCHHCDGSGKTCCPMCDGETVRTEGKSDD